MDKLFNREIESLIRISSAVGNFPEFVQGGGGNTSVKASTGEMLIKASGFELKDVSEDKGFAVVNGEAIRKYFHDIDLVNVLEKEKQSNAFIHEQTIELDGIKKLRPSIETGFHSLLHKYVIHTHSVYSNIINCAENAEQMLTRIFDTKIKPLFIEYYNPGFELSVIMDRKISLYREKEGKEPQVFFLQNHGLIVSADDQKEAIELHKKTNDILKQYFKIQDHYPVIVLKQISESLFESDSSYLLDRFNKYKPNQQFFDRVLFPDQTVFFNGNFHFAEKEEMLKKINVNTNNNKITYATGYREARTIQENMTAYFYILEQMEKHGYKPRFINQNAVDRINNMESEQYRKDLLK